MTTALLVAAVATLIGPVSEPEILRVHVARESHDEVPGSICVA